MSIENLARRFRHEDLCARARRQRGIEIIRGALLLCSGTLALIFPTFAGRTALYALAGLSAGLAGVLLLRMIRARKPRLRQLPVIGAFAILAGFPILAPKAAAFALGACIVVLLLIDGSMKLVGALPDRRHPRRRAFIVSGAITLALAIFFLIRLEMLALVLIGAVAGIALALEGARVLRALWQTRAAGQGS